MKKQYQHWLYCCKKRQYYKLTSQSLYQHPDRGTMWYLGRCRSGETLEAQTLLLIKVADKTLSCRPNFFAHYSLNYPTD